MFSRDQLFFDRGPGLEEIAFLEVELLDGCPD